MIIFILFVVNLKLYVMKLIKIYLDKKLFFLVLFSLISAYSLAQRIYYDGQGHQIEASKADFYRDYKLSKSGKTYSFDEFDISGKKLCQGGCLKFDVSDVSNQVLNGKNIFYFDEGEIHKNYKSGLLIGDVLAYDDLKRLIRVIPTINGEITEDINLRTSYTYYDEVGKNNYFTMKGHEDGEGYFGVISTKMNNDTATYFFSGHDIARVFDSNCKHPFLQTV